MLLLLLLLLLLITHIRESEITVLCRGSMAQNKAGPDSSSNINIVHQLFPKKEISDMRHTHNTVVPLKIVK